MKAFVLGNYMHAHFVHVARLPAAGESLAARRVVAEHGGKGLNLALGLHRLGVDVALLMALGRDASGAEVRLALQGEGVCTEGIVELGEQSGFGVGFIAQDGGNCLAAHLGANALLAPDHVETMRTAIATAGWALATFELADAPIRAAFALARMGGASTYLNPSPWRAIDPALLGLTDVLVVNEGEALRLFGLPGSTRSVDWTQGLPGAAAQFPWRGRLLVVTLGERGCVARVEDQTVFVPAYPVRQVDATGSGDAFAAGLVSALMRGAAPQEALAFGNACGAIVAAREGIWAHLPTPVAVAAFRADQGMPSSSR
jgi:ribokinase